MVAGARAAWVGRAAAAAAAGAAAAAAAAAGTKAATGARARAGLEMPASAELVQHMSNAAAPKMIIFEYRRVHAELTLLLLYTRSSAESEYRSISGWYNYKI